MKKFAFPLGLVLFLLTATVLNAETLPEGPGFTVSGTIRDASTHESMIGVNVFVRETGSGTISNSYGFYSLTLPAGNYTIGYSYIGYQTKEIKISLFQNITGNTDLMVLAESLEEVVVTAEKKNSNITSLEMGSLRLPIQSIRKIPAFMGEVDVIKAIQLLPGVQAAAEGSSGFSVRGGGVDQNLVILDEATVYNASHLLGFFSVFNNDAIKDVKLYKGDIPAAYGGRLSSLLDVRMKEGNMREIKATGGIGSISSRLTLEGPVIKDRTSFLLSGRRTYADVFLPFAKNKDIRDNELYFYDLNAKINHVINENNRIFASGYFGRDVFANQFAGMSFGNKTFSLRWNHLFSPRLFSNFTFVHSIYDYELGTPKDQPNAFVWNSDLKDYSLKTDLVFYASPDNTYKFGLLSTFHELNPGTAKGLGEETVFTEFRVPSTFALQNGAYFQGENTLSPKLSLKYGLRISAFQNIGKATVYNFDSAFNTIDSTVYSKGNFFNTYTALEPRLGLNYTFNENNSVKASYNRSAQYLQLAQNSTAGTPLDIWFTASPNIKPQISDQIAVGYFRNFRNHQIELSVETYYKWMHNTIDFRDHAALLLNPRLEGEVRVGESSSYGLEIMSQLNGNKLNGWISYTWSKTRRIIDGINSGKPYAAPYDKPHSLSLVLNYQFARRLNMGLNWIFSSGLPYTFPVGRYEIMGKILPIFSSRNAYRFDNYHRMDASITLEGKKKEGRRWQSEWNLSVYNVYGRKNTWAINFLQDPSDPNKTIAEKTYLFSVVPAITYNFKF
jgi:hypothetical protein